MKFRNKLLSSLVAEIPYSRGFQPKNPLAIPASVLVLWGESLDSRDFSMLLTKRTERVDTHKGQIAFPGGMQEGEESPVETAMREAEEEVGLKREMIEVVGAMPALQTVTDFIVTPVLALLRCQTKEVNFKTSTEEIDDLFWVSLSHLQHPDTYRQESVTYRGLQYPIHVYPAGKHKIWGVTAEIIKNLLDRFKTVE